jgi:hypothetical protein
MDRRPNLGTVKEFRNILETQWSVWRAYQKSNTLREF